MKIKYFYIIIILIIVFPILSCYIDSSDENTVINSAHLIINHPDSITKASMATPYILDIWILDIDRFEEMAELSPEGLEDYVYFKTINYGVDGIYGDPLNLIVNDLHVNDDYFVMANYYDESGTDELFMSDPRTPVSVKENETTPVTLMKFETWLMILMEG